MLVNLKIDVGVTHSCTLELTHFSYTYCTPFITNELPILDMHINSTPLPCPEVVDPRADAQPWIPQMYRNV